MNPVKSVNLLKLRHREESGSASIEAVIGVPAFVLLVGLIIFGGRTATTHEAVQSAAADAARTASIARNATDAGQQARTAARESLANQHVHCLTIQVHVRTGGFSVPVGRPASVAVSVECRLNLSDLSVPGVPGSRVIRATMTSPIDTWRARA